MCHIHLLIGTPFSVFGLKGILCTDYFALKVCRQRRVVIGEALNSKVSAEERVRHVDMLDLDGDVINLPIGLLRSYELGIRFEIR